MTSRRDFIKLAGASAGLLLPGCQQHLTNKSNQAHVVIIGGGYGGATAAKTIRMLDPSITVTLIEQNPVYTSCPGSNWVFAGMIEERSLLFDYKTLSSHYGISVIHQKVTSINPEKHSLTLVNRQQILFDRLIVAPGIDFRWETIEGHDASSTEQIPHAWKAGAQTSLLNKQLKNMRNGGTVIICAPPNPFKCPPGPYERASMFAAYLKKYKPRSKIIILDPKSHFSKQALFQQGWEQHYGFGRSNSLIEWHSIPDNPVISLDIKNKSVETDFGDRFKADVLNYIPAQKAGKIAKISGLTDSTGWCPVHPISSESTLYPDIHIIGDASIHTPMPKSAFAANSEAKICAFAVVSLLNDKAPQEPAWINTCYSLITENHGISIAMVYKLNQQGKIIKVNKAGGVSEHTDTHSLAMEADYARKWFNSITKDSFA